MTARQAGLLLHGHWAPVYGGRCRASADADRRSARRHGCWAGAARWVLVDAQIDELRGKLRPGFDLCDVPRDAAALNNMGMLPWDVWGAIARSPATTAA